MNRTQFSSLISKGDKKMKHGNKMNGKKKMAMKPKKKKVMAKKKKGSYGK
jgi:hypothetical protein